jgi:serine phosphatase RsbU (regulator of sigma subunit)
MTIIGVTAAAAIVGAFERERRQRVIDESHSRRLVLDTLQDSLVPAPIPPTRVAVTVRYVPGDERLLLGGDFFDAIALPSGALGYIIGDVCGHGPRAAAFGAAVRSGWKTLATVRPDEPLLWVHGLHDTFFRLGRHADTYVTLNTGLVQFDRQQWRFVSAGHPWPIMVTDDAVTMVTPHVGPPLGIGLRSGWNESDQTLHEDATVLLYTDGLTENASRETRRHDDGESRLLGYLDRTRRGFDLDALLSEFGPDGFDDDVAVMAVATTSSLDAP